MSEDKYGSPESGDATSFWDGLIEEAAHEVAQTVNEVGPTVINRPFGSVPVKAADRYTDWLLGKDDPAYWAGEHEKMVAMGHGPEVAVLELLKRDKEMHRRGQNG